MSVKTFVAVSLFVLVALAGCGAKPPVGTIGASTFPVSIDGTADNLYVPFNNGGNPAGDAPVAGKQLQCAQDAGNGGAPPPAPQPCTAASSTIKATFTTLPAPEGGYSLWLTGPTDPAVKVDDLQAGTDGSFKINKTYTEDLDGKHAALELRMGDFVYATTSAKTGPQKFEPAVGLSGITATGSFDAKTLTLTVAGLPANGTFVGRLYTASGLANKTAAESFPVTNGAVTFTSKDHNIGEYVEFHIHVGGSMVNLFKAPLKLAA